MRRREFISGTAATAALSFARPAWAQTNARSPGAKRLAIFHPTDPVELITSSGRPIYKAYFDELKRLGFIEGQNLIVERYSALGETQFGDFARQIVATRPDVILPFTAVFAKEVMALAPGIPMVGGTSDPVTLGLSTSLARPDRNFTGVVVDSGLELWTKRTQLLLETARKLTAVGIIGVNPAKVPIPQGGLSAQVREVAQRTGIKTALIIVAGKIDQAAYERIVDTVIVCGEKLDRAAYERAFEVMGKVGVDGILLTDASEHGAYRDLIVDLAAKFHIPAIYPFRYLVDAGGLMSYGVDLIELFRRVANMTSEVLKGTKPSDIPFYQLTKYDLVLNQKTARSLGLEFAPTLLATADTVIE